jgi:hypothetical protein
MDNQLFYIIHPSLFDFSAIGLSLQERRDRLSEAVQRNGARWAEIRMRAPDFMAAVEKLDRQLSAGEQFVDSAFENSPRRMLPAGSTGEYTPLFGYYEPDQVQGFDRKLKAIPASVIDAWEGSPNGEMLGQVVYAFRSTFAEAAKRKHAVAIDHR